MGLWMMVVLPMTELSSDLKAEFTPEVKSGPLKCAELAADGGMLNAVLALVGFETTAVVGRMDVLLHSLVESDDERRTALNKLCWFDVRVRREEFENQSDAR